MNINTSFIYSSQRMSDGEYQGGSLLNPIEKLTLIVRFKDNRLSSSTLDCPILLPEIDLESSLFYNVQGKTLEVVGVGNIPDVYTDPFNNLNLTVIKKFGEDGNQSLTLKVQNILNDTRESYYDYFGEQRLPFSLYNLDRTITLGYNIKF